MASILIAEDDASTRQLLSRALQADEHETFEAKDGAEALEVARQRSPQLLILDVNMPKMNGFEVARRLQADPGSPDRRIIFLTGAVDEEDHLKGWTVGADAYLTKPFEPEQLSDLVREVLSATPEQLQERREKEIERAKLLRQMGRFLD
ncbi:MAG TPA: response regulator [Actinomycetota bacterium]|nr:response regulator [Actinomycetota bacterium]